MSTLHLLSHSPVGDDRFDSCLRLLGNEDAILLSGEAVQALRTSTHPRQCLEQLPEGIALFALEEDVAARAIGSPPTRIKLLDYPGFVTLCVQYDKVNSWL